MTSKQLVRLKKSELEPKLPVAEGLVRTTSQRIGPSNHAMIRLVRMARGSSAAQMPEFSRRAPGLQRESEASLTINEPGDIYEQEADRIAAEVMRMPASQSADVDRSSSSTSI